ncbi:hypothetical protein HG537_0F00490 [Torulaspora globosa]|uniref:Ribosomal protein S12 n=1 Tax=Torulaspora globosa TaxID=48254 RepID=A0A7H9HU81_9SACH|nr:hypothetical protein HG537_0F00490 [Torulaspora sp. CBS 2947]
MFSALLRRGGLMAGYAGHQGSSSLLSWRNSLQFSTFSVARATLNQIKRGVEAPKRKKVSVSPDLERCPIRKGVVLRVMVLKPKKPNSAQRKACRVRLTNGNVISAYIPGEGHNAQEHSIVYVRGGRCQDLPGVKYHLVRGAGDLGGVVNRVTSRSKYGVKKPSKDV